jgi:hypothetical protein
MNFFRGGVLAMTCVAISLTGCIQQRIQPIIQRPIVSSGPMTINKTAVAGATTRIIFASSTNPDCTLRDIPTVRVLAQPLHGSAISLQAQDFGNFTGTMVACVKVKVSGIAVDYVPAPGYAGPDFMTVETIFSNGVDRTYNVNLTVK